MSTLSRYIDIKKSNAHYGWEKAKRMKVCYLFLAPFALLFFGFVVLPMLTSICFSFTYYNILEPPKFIGLSNYINLLLQDEIFLTAVKNTFVIAVVTGPIGYMLSFVFAWFINELPRWLRTIAVVVFYAPSIAGNAYTIFGIIFRGDAYGYLNAILTDWGIIDQPILWLTNPDYILPVCIIVILWMSMGTGFLSFVAGLQGIDKSMYEAGAIEGIKSRFQELIYITIPSMGPSLMFAAVMQIVSSFTVDIVGRTLAGFPSTDYKVHTIMTHAYDYGWVRYEMGYASAVCFVLFIAMLVCNNLISKLLGKYVD